MGWDFTFVRIVELQLGCKINCNHNYFRWLKMICSFQYHLSELNFQAKILGQLAINFSDLAASKGISLKSMKS